MEHQPPPFFKTGPTPLARLLIFSLLSFVLLFTDTQFKYLESLRRIVSIVIYPLQQIARAPISIATRTGEFFVLHSTLRNENARLVQQNLEDAALLQRYRALLAENTHLRKLLDARDRIKVHSTLAEILYAARDPFTRKIIIDKGFQNDILSGQPVIDEAGVVGQVTRVYPWLSEVTLITDKGQVVPVQNLRNGLRSILTGTGADGVLELKFIPQNADYKNGDQLVTSGIDGVYPPGLPVAEVTDVEQNTSYLFARIRCKPLAGVNNYGQILVVRLESDAPARPAEEIKPQRGKKARRND